jgi:molecular chaperone IbpA
MSNNDLFTLAPFTVGFDDMFDRFNQIKNNLAKQASYPPYNISKVDENKYLIEMAVAGFGKTDLELELQDGVLSVKGTTKESADTYFHKGIANRGFTRNFTLADTIEVKNADLLNGMLKIWLENIIPEHKKPKSIPINEPTTTEKSFLTETSK